MAAKLVKHDVLSLKEREQLTNAYHAANRLDPSDMQELVASDTPKAAKIGVEIKEQLEKIKSGEEIINVVNNPESFLP